MIRESVKACGSDDGHSSAHDARNRSSTPLHPDTARRLGHDGAASMADVPESYDVGSLRRDMEAAVLEVCGSGPGDVQATDLEMITFGMPTRLYLPPRGATHPVVVALHGGGWVSGSIVTHDAVWRRMASRGLAVLAFDYPLSPEHEFPEALNRIGTALDRLDRLGNLPLDTDRVGIVGDSAGGNLAATISLRRADAATPVIAAQVLVYPVIDAAMDSPSYREFGHGYGLTSQKMRFYWDTYCPDAETRSDPRAAPGCTPDALLGAAPPTLVITAECDVLRDESERFAQRLAEAGVPAFAVRYRGQSHGFFRMHAAFTAGSCAADQAALFLLDHLQPDPAPPS